MFLAKEEGLSMRDSHEARVVRFSVWIYRALLAVYPPAFRREYSDHILQVFQDRCRDTLRREGRCGVLRLWLHVLADLGGSALNEYFSEWRVLMHSKVALVVLGLGLFFGCALLDVWLLPVIARAYSGGHPLFLAPLEMAVVALLSYLLVPALITAGGLHLVRRRAKSR